MSRAMLKSTAVVGGMTLVSRVFGLIRDIVIARAFGAAADTDAFFVAFRISNLLRRLFAEGSFAQAFVPVLAEYRERRDADAVRALADHAVRTLGLALFLITLLGVLIAPLLVMIFAPGFVDSAGQYDLAVGMLRVMFPYLLFISLTAFAGAMLNTYGNFAVPAFTPVLLNLALIAGALWFAPRLAEPITALAWAVLIAGLVQLLFQLPFLLRLGLLPVPWRGRDLEGVRRILKLMLPTLFGVSVAQINLMVDTIIASFLIAGSISWLYYSDRMMEFPLGVFGIALATVILPQLSAQNARNSRDGFVRMLDWGLRWVFLITLPAAAGLAALAAPVMVTLFQYQEFSAHDASMAARSLMAYAVGLPALVLVKILASGFYSRQDTRTPVRAGVVAMVANIVLSLALMVPLEHVGLALATSLAAVINAGLLYLGLRAAGAYQPLPGWHPFLLRVVFACACMVAILLAFQPPLEQWLAWGAHQRAMQLGLWVVVGLVVYPLALMLSGLRRSNLPEAVRPV